MTPGELDAIAERNRTAPPQNLNIRARPDFTTEMLKDRVRLSGELRDTREELNTAEGNLREIREYIEQADYVVERLPESDEKAELGAILEQRFAVISGCRECGYPLFSTHETLCRFCDTAPMVEQDTPEEARGKR